MKQKITHEQLREELEAGMSVRKIAEKYNMSERVVQIRKRKLKETGWDPENDRYHKNPEEHPVKGYSTAHRLKHKDDPTPGKIIEWVKTNVHLSQQIDTAKHIVQSLAEELPQIHPIQSRPTSYDKSKFTVLPIGDPHIGLMTWSKEVGEDWDLSIAKRVFNSVFNRLLSRCPDTEECILVNTGDFFHADNVQGETARSGHKLDLDGRYGKWLDAGVIIARMLIEACLMKYKKVTFVNVPGNHDDVLGMAIGIFTDHLYDKQERLTVLRGENPFQYIHRGKILLGFAHGHKCKLPALPGKMASDQHKLWGITEERHWITGHVHHNQWLQYKEHPGCTVESVGIIPPKDAYAYGGAYGGKRSTQAMIFDSEHGEYERYYEKVRVTD